MKKIKLGNITSKIGSGATPRGGKNTYGKNGVAFIRSQNVRDFYFDYNQLAFINDNQASQLSNVEVKLNDILLNITGDSITRCTLSPEDILPARVSQHVAIVRCHKNINSKFIMYNLQYMKNYLLSICKIGGTRNALTKEMLENLPIDLPPKETQDKIAALLGALDDKITLNKKMNATLEAMAKTLYDYWFVQFDFPDENGKPYKTSGGKMIYNAELGQDIPDGWKVQNLSEITTIIQGNSPDGSTLNDTGEGTIFFQGKTDFGFRFPEVRIYTTAPYRLAEKFDTLLSVRAPVGDANMAYEKCCIGRGLAAIHSDYPSFIYYTLKKLKPIFEKLGSIGTTFDSITKNDVMALKICIPPTKFVEKFENVVSKFDTEIFSNTNESRQLAALRDWLLPMLMNGQLNFKDV